MGEEVYGKDDGRLGAGVIVYDKIRGMYLYNGSCYLNSMKSYSRWSTVVSYLSEERQTLFYIFRGSIVGNDASDHYGFGAIRLFERGSKLTPVDGYFISPPVDGRVQSHSMFRLNFSYDPSDDGRMLFDFMKKRGEGGK